MKTIYAVLLIVIAALFAVALVTPSVANAKVPANKQNCKAYAKDIKALGKNIKKAKSDVKKTLAKLKRNRSQAKKNGAWSKEHETGYKCNVKIQKTWLKNTTKTYSKEIQRFKRYMRQEC